MPTCSPTASCSSKVFPTSRRWASCASARTEILQCDLSLERDGVVALREAVAYSDSVGDYVSRQLFVKILDSEEEHIDWLETQLDLIERIGEPKYLLSKLEE